MVGRFRHGANQPARRKKTFQSLETWAGRYKAKLRYRLERPLDAVWRSSRLDSSLYRAARELPEHSSGKAWAAFLQGDPRTDEVVEACLALFEERKGTLEGYMRERDKELATYFYDVAHEGGFGDHSKLLIDYMAQPAILNGVMRYLGDVPLLQGVKLYWTPRNEKMVSSQQWHMDGGDHPPTEVVSLSERYRRRRGPAHDYPGGGKPQNRQEVRIT